MASESRLSTFTHDYPPTDTDQSEDVHSNHAHDEILQSESMARLATSQSESDNASSVFHDAPQSRPSKRRRLASLGHEVKGKPKELLNKIKRVSVDESPSTRTKNENEQDVNSNLALNPALVFKNRQDTSLEDKLKGSVESIGKATRAPLHPRKAIKSSAAKRITTSNNPYLTREADEKLLEAHDELDKVSSSKNGTDNEDVIKARSVVERIETQRDEMRAAWITSKHIQRVRVVPKQLVPYPRRARYEVYGEDSKRKRTDWLGWIGHVLLYLSQDFSTQYIDETDEIPFSRATLAQNAERFLIATAPWQMWLMRVRKVYRWDDPWLTGRWLALYLFLLKFGYVMTFFYSYIVYIVLMNKLYPQSANELRDSYKRAVDRSNQVHQFGELIERHGGDKWLDPLIDEMGPLVQQQLADTADFLEVLINFYRWQYKWGTINTLIFWTTGAIVAAFTSLEYGSKIVWFVCGLFFFVSRPIASRYPKYRRVVSIFRVIYWDIPTFAEQAFQQLRYEAQETRKKIASRIIDDTIPTEMSLETPAKENGTLPEIIRSRSSSSSSLSSLTSAKSSISRPSASGPSVYASPLVMLADSSNTVLTLRCRWRRQHGKLIFTTSGIHFIRASPGNSKPTWARSYAELVEIKKLRTASTVLPGSTTRAGKILPSKVTSSKGLGFVWMDGSEDVLERLRNRDEAFNCAVGFSGSRWMVVDPPGEDPPATDGEGSDEES